MYRDRYFVKRRSLSSGLNRSVSRCLVEAQIQFGYGRVFDLRAECWLGPFRLNLAPTRGSSRFPFQKPTRYEGKLVVPNAQEGVVVVDNLIGKPLVSISTGSETITLDRVRAHDPYSKCVLAIASLGQIAELITDERGMKLGELWRSRFGFEKVTIGKWCFESKIVDALGSPPIACSVLSVMLLHQILVPRTVAPPTPIGS